MTALGTEPVTYTVYRVSVELHGQGALHLRGSDGWDIEYAVSFKNRALLSEAQRYGWAVSPHFLGECIHAVYNWRQWRRQAQWNNGPPPILLSTGDRTPEERPTPPPSGFVPRAGRLMTFADEDV